MPGALWVVLLLTLGGLFLAHHAPPLPSGKPRLSPTKAGYWLVRFRGETYGPFVDHPAAQRAALLLIEKDGTR